MEKALGTSDPRKKGYRRAMKGFREGDYRELSMGLALTAIAYLQETRPRKQLIYRRRLPEGTVLVIHHKNRGNPRLEIVRPSKK